MGEGRLEGNVTSPGDWGVGVETGGEGDGSVGGPQVPGSQTVPDLCLVEVRPHETCSGASRWWRWSGLGAGE